MRNIKKFALVVLFGTLFAAFFSALCVSCYNYKPVPFCFIWIIFTPQLFIFLISLDLAIFL